MASASDKLPSSPLGVTNDVLGSVIKLQWQAMLVMDSDDFLDGWLWVV